MTYKSGHRGCSLYLHRWSMLGYIVDNLSKTDHILDVLDENQDIVETYALTKYGFDRIKYTLRPRRVHV
jgi:hypothetical protein